MKLSKEEVAKLAHLARLKLSPEETEKYSSELTQILSSVEILNEVDTEGVEVTNQVTGLSDVIRSDEVDMSLCKPDELLEASPLPKANRQIRVKRVI